MYDIYICIHAYYISYHTKRVSSRAPVCSSSLCAPHVVYVRDDLEYLFNLVCTIILFASLATRPAVA